MRVTLRLLLLLVVLTVAVPTLAQKKKKTAERDTIQVPFFHGVALQIDLLTAGLATFSDHGQYEAGIRVNLRDRYFPAVEVGYGISDESEEYESELWCKEKAPFFRVGCDFNMLKNKHDHYRLFAGVRYGFSKFKYDMTVKDEFVTTYIPEPEIEGEVPEEVEVTTYEYRECRGCRATYHWLELLLGVDAQVWGPLHLGWDVRYRRVLAKSYDENGAPWYIPGFGNRSRGKFIITFNLIISI